MYVISIEYVKLPEQVDVHRDAHAAWVHDGFRAGVFLAAGRNVQHTGGIILATGERNRLDGLLALDPFHVAGVAAYTVTEFTVSTVAQGLESLKGL